MPTNNANGAVHFEFNPDDLDSDVGGGSNVGGGIVSIGGELPYNIQISTSRLLDILTSLSPGFQQLSSQEKKGWRTKLSRKLYPWTRPGFYKRLNEALHLGYAGQPGGHGTQHYWRLFYRHPARITLTLQVRS